MGFVIAHFKEGDRVIFGDPRDVEAARKYMGLPHRDKDGRYVSEQELRQRDKMGE